MKRFAAATLIGLATSAVHADCLPVTGQVQLTPETNCTNAVSMVPGVPQDASQCFAVTLSMLGLPVGRGYAAVTDELMFDTNGMPAQTPLVMPEDYLLPGAPAPLPRQIVQTARSAIAMGRGGLRTVLYSGDITVIRPRFGPDGSPAEPVVTEQIVITGTNEQGLLAGATGHLVVLGNSIGQDARVVGELCIE